jgi:hypothetical protein
MIIIVLTGYSQQPALSIGQRDEKRSTVISLSSELI